MVFKSRFLAFLILFPLSIISLQAQKNKPHSNIFGCSGGETNHLHARGSGYINRSSDRSFDGSDNNLHKPEYGQADIPFERLAAAQYDGDGYSLIDRANAREISNILCNQEESIPSKSNLSIFMYSWLQFLDHDITITEESHDESIAIEVPLGDTYFDPFYTGTQTIPLSRVAIEEGTGTSTFNPREQTNVITAWVDASNVYGSDGVRADWLRTMKNGKLKTSSSPNGDILPCNTTTGDCNDPIDLDAPEMAGQDDLCGDRVKVFVAGDVRANEQPGLTALHTLFVLEHNRICDELIADGSYNDQDNYNYARKMVGALMQSITYNEVLPALGVKLNHYGGYKSNKSPNIFNEFATAAYRLGHTMVNSQIPYLTEDCENAEILSGCGEGTQGVSDGTTCQTACSSETFEEPLALLDGFFNASLLANNGLESILNGMASQVQEEVDLKIVGDIRNFLFGPPGAGGLDLASINIQRARDHGLADYNSIRKSVGLSRLTNFNQITSDKDIAESLKSLYGNINNIDAWIGMLAEDHLSDSSIGETLHTILKLQFENLRDADRFWFEVDKKLNASTRTQIYKTKLADVINRNTTLSKLSNVFYTKDCVNSVENIYCAVKARNSSKEWIEKVKFDGTVYSSGNDKGYGDYTDESINLMAGGASYFQLTPGYSGYKYTQKWLIWIDLDQDGTFSKEEKLYARGGKTKSGRIYIPKDALPGITRMRIAMSGNKTPTACGTFQYGEVEDYTVSISSFNGVYRISEDAANFELEEDLFFEDEEQVILYPNPIESGSTLYLYYYISKSSVDTYPVQVFNMLGEKLYEKEVHNRVGYNTIDIPLGDLQAGQYILMYNNGYRMVGETFEVFNF